MTGGGGYIGSHVAKCLYDHGFTPVSWDNLGRGNRWAVRWGPLIESNLANITKAAAAIKCHDIKAVVHCAAFASVSESFASPGLYYSNNVIDSLKMLRMLVSIGLEYVVFTSSCSVYGVPACSLVEEGADLRPVSPYGETKRVIEEALRWYSSVGQLRSVSLRCFNVAGANVASGIGETRSHETHLIPLALESIVSSGFIQVCGSDYATPDGTCIRDYVHVMDVAEAHVGAVEYLLAGGESTELNIGSGRGHSVREIVEAVQKLTGSALKSVGAPGRTGDPARIVSNPRRAQDVLRWVPARSDLDSIISSAWEWKKGFHAVVSPNDAKLQHTGDLSVKYRR